MRILWISKASVTASYRKKIAWLAKLGLEIGVVTGNSWGPWRYEDSPEDQNYRIFRLPQSLSGRNQFHWYQGLRQVMKEFRPDIVHIDEEHYSLVTFQAARAAAALHVPFVFQTWQNIYKRYPLPFSAMERYVFSKASQAIAGTQEIREVLKQQGFTKPVHIVPLGVDTDLFYPYQKSVHRAHFGFSNHFVVGYIGRLVPEKGVMDLADALLPVLEARPDWIWVVAGSGPLQRALQERMAPVHDQVRVLPWLSTSELTHLMNALDVLAVPSKTTAHWKEQFGRVLIEAMAVELPVVAYASGEIPHVVGDAGVLVPEGDIQGLRDALSGLVEDAQAAARYRTQGRQRVLSHFSQERVARLLMDVYNSFK